MELTSGADDADRRLDRILRKALPDHPLSLLHRLLRQGRVLVDGTPAGAGDRVPSGAVISVPGVSPPPRSGPPLSPCPHAALDVLWQGAGLLVLNKPAGLAVHGTGGMDGLVRAYLAKRLAERPSHSLSFRPGPLHRLDRPTSGVIVFSSSLAGARLFSTLLRERRVCKSYLAIVEGGLAAAEIWQDALVRDRDAKKTCTAGPEEGKTALTRVRPLAAAGGCTLLHAEIETGRTHQIRAQAAAHGHPLAGDRKYGARALPGERAGRGGFFLHAWKIELREMPLDVPFPPSFTAPPPPAFQERLCSLFGDSFLLP